MNKCDRCGAKAMAGNSMVLFNTKPDGERVICELTIRCKGTCDDRNYFKSRDLSCDVLSDLLSAYGMTEDVKEQCGL